MRDKVLEKIQKETQKKVMMNFQIDPDLKASFEEVCKYDRVTMSAAIIAMIETYIEEANTERYKAIRQIMTKVEDLTNELKSEKDLTSEKENELFALKESIDKYVEKEGQIVPDSNNWNYIAVENLERHLLMIDSSIHFYNKKDKK